MGKEFKNAIKILKLYINLDDNENTMKSKIVKELFYNKRKDLIDLTGISVPKYTIKFSRTKAKSIWNDFQKANEIYNYHQRTNVKICNHWQKSKEIINYYQTADNILNDSQSGKKINNSKQTGGDEINNSGQKSKKFNNDNQKIIEEKKWKQY